MAALELYTPALHAKYTSPISVGWLVRAAVYCVVGLPTSIIHELLTNYKGVIL